jgi:U32 family peptidase
MRKIELLSPVGNWEMLVAAVEAGANSVYLGIKGLNMRERANNFSIEDLKKITDYAHKNKVRVYLTVNTIIFDEELKIIKDILTAAKKAKVDAIICWDLAVISLCKKLKLEIHLSTQGSSSNAESIKLYKKLGVKRFVIARECSLEQVKDLSKKADIEVFAHGAMCVSVSGRCFLSQFLYGDKTSANRGKCIQPCRRSYIVKDSETDKELKIDNHYIMSPKDLCTLPFIEKLIKSNVKCLKIEGRARSPEYVKIVTEVYRRAIDSYYSKKLDKTLKKKLMDKLKTVYNRGFSSGFYLGKPINEWTKDYGSRATKKKTYIGKITNFYKKISVAEIRINTGKVSIRDNILIIGPTTGVHEQKVSAIQIDKKKTPKSAKKGQVIGVKVSKVCRKNDKVYLFK